MMMETFALADNSWQASLRNDNHNPYEMYKMRLVRVDTVGALSAFEDDNPNKSTALTFRLQSWSWISNGLIRTHLGLLIFSHDF